MMFDQYDLRALQKERDRAVELWGEDFDTANTLNDWVTYICTYATRASDFRNRKDASAQYAALIKAANLALTAAARVRSEKVAPRHYDLAERIRQ